MESTNGIKQFESAYKQLSDKRDKYRISIRKESIKTMLAEKRRRLVEQLHDRMVKNIKNMFVKISNNEVTQFISIIKDELKCDQFNDVLLQMRIDVDLVHAINDSGLTLKSKAIAVDLLTQLASYSKQTNIAFVRPEIVHLLLEQIRKQSFNYVQQQQYILSMLKLLSVMVRLPVNQLHQRLLNTRFCGRLHRRLKDEVDDLQEVWAYGKHIWKFICKIRSGLIQNVYDWQFVKDSLSFLTDYASEYNRFEREPVCQLLLSIVDSCPQDLIHTLQDHLSDSIVLSIFKHIMKAKPNQEQSLKILYVLKALYDKFRFKIVPIPLSFIPIQFFIDCLKHPSATLHRQAISIISLIMQPFMRRYKYVAQYSQCIAQFTLNAIETYQCQVGDCLRMIQSMTRGQRWPDAIEDLLNKKLLGQLSDVFNREEVKNEHLIKLLNILDNLVKYDKHCSQTKIRKCLISGGMCQLLKQLQRHQDRDIGRWTEKLYQELLQVDSKLSDD